MDLGSVNRQDILGTLVADADVSIRDGEGQLIDDHLDLDLLLRPLHGRPGPLHHRAPRSVPSRTIRAAVAQLPTARCSASRAAGATAPSAPHGTGRTAAAGRWAAEPGCGARPGPLRPTRAVFTGRATRGPAARHGSTRPGRSSGHSERCGSGPWCLPFGITSHVGATCRLLLDDGTRCALWRNSECTSSCVLFSHCRPVPVAWALGRSPDCGRASWWALLAAAFRKYCRCLPAWTGPPVVPFRGASPGR